MKIQPETQPGPKPSCQAKPAFTIENVKCHWFRKPQSHVNLKWMYNLNQCANKLYIPTSHRTGRESSLPLSLSLESGLFSAPRVRHECSTQMLNDARYLISSIKMLNAFMTSFEYLVEIFRVFIYIYYFGSMTTAQIYRTIISHLTCLFQLCFFFSWTIYARKYVFIYTYVRTTPMTWAARPKKQLKI